MPRPACITTATVFVIALVLAPLVAAAAACGGGAPGLGDSAATESCRDAGADALPVLFVGPGPVCATGE
jgi:hypothetical protein